MTKHDLFAAIPERAMRDERLTGSHWRVLGKFALHDRRSLRTGQGAGCWISHETIATECGVNYTNLSTIVRELMEWGYLTRTRRPEKRTQYVYRVIYDDVPDKEERPDSLPKREASGAQIVCPEGKLSGANSLPSREPNAAASLQKCALRDSAKQKREEITHKRRSNFVTPDWIPQKAWADFEDMRRTIKRPLTDAARVLTVKALEALRAAGYDPVACLDQSIQAGYSGVFATRRVEPPREPRKIFTAKDFPWYEEERAEAEAKAKAAEAAKHVTH